MAILIYMYERFIWAPWMCKRQKLVKPRITN